MNTDYPSALDTRSQLAQARLMLLFEPDRLGSAAEALDRLGSALPFVQVVQVRVKRPGHTDGPSPARPLLDWTLRVLERIAAHALRRSPLVIVNDRPDVARALLAKGVHGVHLGQLDAPPQAVRDFLGPLPLIGLSTKDLRQVAKAQTEAVDYLGFGPVYPSRTKGYASGIGPERALIAHTASAIPVFPIGGIDAQGAMELVDVGRAAVSAAILEAPDPGCAARELFELLGKP